MNILFVVEDESMSDKVPLRKLRRSRVDDDDDELDNEDVEDDEDACDVSKLPSSSPSFRVAVTAFNKHCIADAAADESPKKGKKINNCYVILHIMICSRI